VRKEQGFFFLILICGLLLFHNPVSAFEIEEEAAGAGPQIVPYLINFNWGPGSGAITMYDPCTYSPILTPEFNLSTGLNNPAAYVRGAHLEIKVKWYVRWGTVTEAMVGAKGSLGGLPATLVTFSGSTSDWITMSPPDPLPDEIAVNEVSWTWGYKIGADPVRKIGTSTHAIYGLNAAPITSPVYRPLVEWTTDWCLGLPDDDKAIADAIMAGFAATGVIKYGASGWDTAEILCSRDGMCGGMKEVFYDACGTQGVHVARSCYILKDADSGAEYKWNSMIIFSAGVGRTEPTFSSQKIREVDAVYPCPLYLGDSSSSDDVFVETRRAYEFFAPYDGHCINFLEYGGNLYLYDLSFGTGPWPDTFTALPYGNKSGTQLYGFRENYMNTALDYMRGQIYYSTGGPCSVLSTKMDIDSHIIPYESDEFLYNWSTNP